LAVGSGHEGFVATRIEQKMEHERRMNSVEIDKINGRIASMDSAGNLQIWDFVTKQQLASGATKSGLYLTTISSSARTLTYPV
jgi:hypothetical protein